MKHVSVLVFTILLLSPIFFLNEDVLSAQEQPLEVELTVEEDVPLVEFGEETTIDMKFTQRGFNWTKLSESGKPLKDFLFAKIYLPIMFRSIIFLLGYNSVVFEADVIGNPLGWEAWVEPNSVTYFTGDKSVELELHVKVSRPTTANTALVRITFTAYGGDNSLMGVANSDILVSIKQYHLAEVTAVQQFKEVSPDTIVYFPIEVTNRGNYEDTFSFETSNESNGFLGLVSGQLTLSPGETGQISLMLLTPYTFFYDFGSKTSLNISAYSIYEPSKKFSTMIQITSRGFYMSDLFIFSIILMIFILIFVYIMISFILEKRNIEVYGKPNKPWSIPEEKKYLEKLKEKNKEEYEKIRQMMNDEYQSALLWFKSYREELKWKEKEKKEKVEGGKKTGLLTNRFRKSDKSNELKPMEKEDGTKKPEELVKNEKQKSSEPKEKDRSVIKEQLEKVEDLFRISFEKLFRKHKKKEKSVEEKTQEIRNTKPQEPRKEEKIKRSEYKQEIDKHKEKSLLKIRRKQKKQRRKLAK